MCLIALTDRLQLKQREELMINEVKNEKVLDELVQELQRLRGKAGVVANTNVRIIRLKNHDNRGDVG